MILIAEFCQNHNGNFDILKKMIDEAAEGGATHAKIQTIFANDVSYREEFENGKTDKDGKVLIIKRPYQPEYDRLKKLELSYEQHALFIELCKKANMIPLTTAFNITSIPHLKAMGWKMIKVASYDCASYPLIEELAKHFDELLVSTGATYDEEIEKTAHILNDLNKKFSFLHCVTIYPTPLEKMNLKRMHFLKKFTPRIGLSDHSLVSKDGVKASIGALYLGASIIERHFTILPENDTRDGKVSIQKNHFTELVKFNKLSAAEKTNYIKEKIPEFESMLGVENRALSHEELLNRAYYRGRFCNKIDGKQIYNWEWQ